jgi:pimeloyl-ACP methyl ester carboxylesterase
MEWLKLPGSVVLFWQLTTLFAAAGFLLAAAVSGDRRRWGRVLGTGPDRLTGAALTFRSALVGAVLALIFVFSAVRRGAHLGGIPGFGPLLFGAFAAVGVLTVILAAVGEGRRPTLTEASVAGACGVGAALLLAGAFSHSAAAATVVAFAAAGALAGVEWPFMAARARTLVLRLTHWSLQPRPLALRARELLGAGIGALLGGAVVAAGGPRAPWWLAAALLGALVVGLSASGRLIPPVVAVRQRELAGFSSPVIIARGDGGQPRERWREARNRGDEAGELRVEARERGGEARERRRGEGPPVVFVHGVGHSAATWRLVITALTRLSGRRFAAVSVPGVARGVGPLGAGDKLPQMVDWLRAAVKELFPGEKVLGVGHSLGGWLVLTLARDDPAGAVLCAVVGVNTMGLGTHRLIRVGGRPLVGWLARKIVNLTPAPLRAFVAGLVYRTANPLAGDDDVRLVKEGARRLTKDPKELHRWMDVGVDVLQELAEHPIDLGHVRVPCHLMWAEQDEVSPVVGAERVRAEWPHVTITMTPDWDHSPHVSDPVGLAQVLVRSPTWLVGNPSERHPRGPGAIARSRPRRWRRR